MAAFNRKHILWSAAFGGLVFFSAVFAKQAAAPSPVEPNKDEVKATRSTVMMLKHLHYERKKLDDTFSSQVLDRYLKDLDGSRAYFLASDIQEFEAYRYQFDDDLARGDLTRAFAIYSRYQQRFNQRLDFVLAELKKAQTTLTLAKMTV
jgi:carboxyl-terminal processing protease